MLRLADDREQEECRVLMKFWWQLAMTSGPFIHDRGYKAMRAERDA
jgi:hypothetical protein